ncbi:MAG: dihydroneopterin aldolase [Thaumarchaeota archaeon]|nr:dihydroneopterin aldolase [Nitrososphaerota archaeon]
MTDRIFVDNLRLSCRVGITPEERLKSQEVLLDVSLSLSLAPAAASDSVKDTVNYKEIMERVSRFVSSKEFSLLESLAEGVAAVALEAFPVERVTVKARKAKYSAEPSVGIEITRDRKPWSSRS